MSELIDDLRRYGEAVESEVLPDVRRPDGTPATTQRRSALSLWWAAAAALVIVALLGALLAVRSTGRPTSVDQPGDVTPGDVEPTSPAEVPLLGFADQPLRIRTYSPDGSYEVFRLTDGPDPAVSGTLEVTSGTAFDPNTGPVPEGPSSDATATVAIDGRAVPVVRRVSSFGNDELTATWNPTDHSIARLVVTASPALQASPPIDPMDAIRTAASQVTRVSRQGFVDALDAPGPDGDNLAPLITTNPDETVLVEDYPTAKVVLELSGVNPAREGRLEISGPGAGGGEGALDYYAQRATPATVRGTSGHYLTGSASDQLVWSTGTTLYSLTLPRGTGQTEAINFANSLKPPTTAEWTSILFPNSG